jgi:putative transposase
MTTYIDEHKGSFGVEPICRILAVAPSSYYAAKTRPPSARAIRDVTLGADSSRIHRSNYAVYGRSQAVAPAPPRRDRRRA